MFAFLSKFFVKKGIFLWAPLPLEACLLQKPYLLERVGIQNGTAILLAVPYFSAACEDAARNLSCYAVPRDYHGYFKALFDELIPLLEAEFPNYRFAGFADHSPILEVDAAAKAGLGLLGDNHLLITEPYSSFVFLGSLITDAVIPCEAREPLRCEGCGRCRAACPAENGEGCLSAITQKKGELTADEAILLRKNGSVWGCDRCQLACPHTEKARRAGTIYSPIPYFCEDTLSHLTLSTLSETSDEEFSDRAYAWRGRKTVKRNLMLLESDEKQGDTSC